VKDDFLDQIAKAAPKKPQRVTRADVATGLGSKPLDLRERVHEAADTGKSIRHGKYVQFTMRLEEETVEAIKQWAEEVGVPQTHMYRWIVARGLVALAEGERPEIEYPQVPKVIPPKSEA
jgi:hypothetical protein